MTYVLLFLLPPLGIYLLWRRNRFEQPIRYAISAASAIWFIVALVRIFTSIFGNTGDEQSTITSLSVTIVSRFCEPLPLYRAFRQRRHQYRR